VQTVAAIIPNLAAAKKCWIIFPTF